MEGSSKLQALPKPDSPEHLEPCVESHYRK